jgi:hypothetical protein
MSKEDGNFVDKKYRVPMLTSTNYPAWERAMTMRLKAERCLSVVDGRLRAPDPIPDADPAANAAGQRAHETRLAEYSKKLDDFESAEGSAASAINSTLSPEVETLLKDTMDPVEMWSILKEKLNTATSRTLQRSVVHTFNATSHDGKETIQNYLRRLRDLQRQVTGTEEEITDGQILSKVLHSLPEVYRPKIAAIEDRPDLTIDLLESYLVGYQTHLQTTGHLGTTSSTSAFAARGGKRKGFSGGGRGRGKTPAGISKDVKCWYCLKKGHTQNDCRLKKAADRERNDRQKAKKDSEKPSESSSAASAKAAITDAQRFTDITEEEDLDVAMALVMSANKSTRSSSGSWYIDSGATDHMCHDRSLFGALKRLSVPREVSLGDNSKVLAFGTGEVPISANRTLGSVLYVPDLGMNLLSVSAVTKLGYTVTFEQNACRVTLGDATVLLAVKHGSLYKVTEARVPTREPREVHERALSLTSKPVLANYESTRWHARLGHLNMGDLRKLSGMAVGIPGTLPVDLPACESCVEAKMSRRFNRDSQVARESQPLGLVHSDSCGPFRVASIAGTRYFILFIDDSTRLAWVYFLKHKNSAEVLQAFKEFKAAAENKSGCSIKRFRCDNGRAEYDNSDFQTLLKSDGISYEPSAPYTQHQNGVSERSIRTVVERARSMLLGASLPQRFWAEAINTAVYLRNRSPTQALEGKTPFEAWYGQKPDIGHLRKFGCLAFLHVPDGQRSKLDPKARRCLLLGYVHNTKKIWRLWDIGGRRVISGADVIFHEDQIGLVDDEVTTEDSETPALSQEHAGVTTDKIEVLGQEMATSAKDHELSLAPDLGTEKSLDTLEKGREESIRIEGEASSVPVLLFCQWLLTAWQTSRKSPLPRRKRPQTAKSPWPETAWNRIHHYVDLRDHERLQSGSTR